MAQEQQGFYEYNGNTFFKDKFGSWFVKASGYESIYLSGIKDEGLLQAVHYELNTNPASKINFQHDNKWYTIWNNPDATQIKIDRKGEHNEAPMSDSTYDRTEETKAEANASKGAQAVAANKAAMNRFGSGSNTQASDGKSKYFVDEVKVITMSIEEFKNGLKFEPFWNLSKDATQNIMLVKDGDRTEYHIILAHKKPF